MQRRVARAVEEIAEQGGADRVGPFARARPDRDGSVLPRVVAREQAAREEGAADQIVAGRREAGAETEQAFTDRRGGGGVIQSARLEKAARVFGCAIEREREAGADQGGGQFLSCQQFCAGYAVGRRGD